MVKRELRKIYSQKRLQLTNDEFHSLSDAVVDNFSSLALQGIQYLLSYYPITERNEFDVTVCEQLLALDNERLQVAWPRLEADEFTMNAVLKTSKTTFVKNKFGIMEPVGSEVADPQLIDAVFVPLLSFDIKGFRVGYGKGYYDRFLSRCAQDVVKIGFSFFEATDNIDDINPFDVPLNYCITPLRVYEF